MHPARSPRLIAPLLALLAAPALALAAEPAPAKMPNATEEVAPAVGLGFVNPVQAPASLRDLVETTSFDSRQHVHVFLVNGCDPLCVGNMNGLCAYVKSLGFSAEFDQMYGARSVYRKAKFAHETDPGAKIVLMGFSLGANTVRTVAQWLEKDGVPVDLLYYLAADAVSDGAGTKPGNVARIINVTGHGSPFFGGDAFITPVKIHGADNIHLDAKHFALPSQSKVVEALVRELLILAGGGAVVPAPTTVRGVSEQTPAAPSSLRIP